MQKWSGSRDLHPDRLLHRERCCCYTTVLINWSPWSDSHRRIRVYETRPVAAEAQGLKMVSTTGIAPVTSGFARRRSDLTELRGQMASVIGLAPIRPGLKDRLLELLCIHGQKFEMENETRSGLLTGRH